MSAPDRDHVREEVEMTKEIAALLRKVFPMSAFVVSHIPCYAVTFYQATGDAPTESEPVSDYDKETQFCNTCGDSRPYRPLPHPDPEFPYIRWGACLMCGTDLALTEDEIRILVNATR